MKPAASASGSRWADAHRRANPSPGHLIGKEMKEIDMELFNRIKELLDTSGTEGITSQVFHEKTKALFESKGVKHFLSDPGDAENADGFMLRDIAELYRTTYLISREHADKKEKHSAEELLFMHHMSGMTAHVQKNRPAVHEVPLKYDLVQIVWRMISCAHVVQQLKQSGFNGNPQGMTYGDVISAHNKDVPVQDGNPLYQITLDDELAGQKVHDHLSANMEALLSRKERIDGLMMKYPKGILSD
ncbi:hypothetical protein ACFL3V_06335 [Nanoarchaeota archaeon]